MDVPTATAVEMTAVEMPATLLLLWQRVKGIQAAGNLHASRCPCGTCPYCTGQLMQQRYELMVRLVELELQLYGV